MDAQRKEEFRAWVASPESGYNATDESIAGYIRDIDFVERHTETDVDGEFELDGLVCLYSSLKYTTADYRHPNQARMGWTADTPRDTISAYRTAINHYKVFCETFYPRQVD